MNQSEPLLRSHDPTHQSPLIIHSIQSPLGKKCYFWNVGGHLCYHSNGMLKTNENTPLRSHDLFHQSPLITVPPSWNLLWSDGGRTKQGQKAPDILLEYHNRLAMSMTETRCQNTGDGNPKVEESHLPICPQNREYKWTFSLIRKYERWFFSQTGDKIWIKWQRFGFWAPLWLLYWIFIFPKIINGTWLILRYYRTSIIYIYINIK